MSVAYYVCPVIGSGTHEDMYRPKVAEYDVNYTSAGSNIKGWSIVCVNASDHSALIADSQIYLLSDTTLDTLYSELTSAQQNRIVTCLTYAGISYTPNGSDSLRTILNLFFNEFTTSMIDALSVGV